MLCSTTEEMLTGRGMRIRWEVKSVWQNSLSQCQINNTQEKCDDLFSAGNMHTLAEFAKECGRSLQKGKGWS